MGGLGALAAGVERRRKVESRLMIERVCGDFLFELGHRAEMLADSPLLGAADRAAILQRIERAPEAVQVAVRKEP